MAKIEPKGSQASTQKEAGSNQQDVAQRVRQPQDAEYHVQHDGGSDRDSDHGQNIQDQEDIEEGVLMAPGVMTRSMRRKAIEQGLSARLAALD